EAEADERLILRTGGLDLFPEGAAIPAADYTDSMSVCGVPFEEMDGGEAMHRWPQWRLDDAVKVLYQSEAGIAAASRCNATHRRLAVAHGATLRDRTRVAGLRDRDGEGDVIVEGGGAVRCRKAVLAVDAWTNELLEPLGVRLPLTITQEQVVYLRAPDAGAFDPERFPIWIWMDDPSFYGFPAFGEPGPKVAQDVGGRRVAADGRTFDADPDALRRVMAFVERHLPRAHGPVLRLQTCLYTSTPDRDPVVDAVPFPVGAACGACATTASWPTGTVPGPRARPVRGATIGSLHFGVEPEAQATPVDLALEITGYARPSDPNDVEM